LRSIGETDRVVGPERPELRIVGKTDRVVGPVRPEFVNRRPDVASWIVFRTPLV
jgi:hypothetical protein